MRERGLEEEGNKELVTALDGRHPKLLKRIEQREIGEEKKRVALEKELVTIKEEINMYRIVISPKILFNSFDSTHDSMVHLLSFHLQQFTISSQDMENM